MFPAPVYTRRRDGLRSRLRGGLALFLGNGESPMNYTANAYPFRQDSSFLYYFGLDQPGLAAVVDLDSGADTVYGEDVGIEDIIWVGPQPKIRDRAREAGVRLSAPIARLEEDLRAARAAGRPVLYLPPYRAENSARMAALLEVPAGELKAKASVDLIRAVVDQRSVKSDAEVAQIEEALAVTREMYRYAFRAAKAGRLEANVAGGMEGIARSHNVGTAFPLIVTVNGQVFHNPNYGNRLTRGRMLVVDGGAESPLRYACDITRTIPVGGKFDARQKAIYSLVLKGQLAAIDAIAPGVPYKEVHLKTARILAEGLKDLGLMRGDLDEAVAAGAHALFFPHGLGHMLGLDVHDMESLGEDHIGYGGDVKRSDQFGLAYLRMARELRPGFVMTVEPGVYFIPALAAQWKKEKKHAAFIDFARFREWEGFGGVRIEDDVLVTKSGRRVLGRPIPKSIAEVERAAAE